MQLKKEISDTWKNQRTFRIPVPGVQTLHSRSPDEIGEILSKVINLKDDVTEIRYVLGKYIELVVKDTSPDKFIQVY